ncbi:recombinase XerD [Sphingobium sp. EM0848]|uniref:recombinase XerD n=1 Tax=Sphingobium sp. EM0848 TaxID=2743473 RepID=UPI0035108DC0
MALAERKHAGSFVALDGPTILHLAAAFHAEALEEDDQARWDAEEREQFKAIAVRVDEAGGVNSWAGSERSRWAAKARETQAAALASCKALKASGDLEGVLEEWTEESLLLAEARGFLVSPSDPLLPELCRALNDAAILASQDRLKRLEGEDVPTPAEPEPPTTPAKAARKKGGEVLLMPTFEAYATAQGISEGVRREWRKYIQSLIGFVGHDDARRLTRDDVVAWRDHLQTTPMRNGALRKPVTVRDKYITALRCTLAWATEEKRLDENVASDVKVRIPKVAKVRDKDFTMDEAKAILKASLVAPTGRLSAPYVRARRWIPWLCAYSGARVNELSQLRKEDIFQSEGVWVMRITPEAGSVKTREARLVPLHPHVIEQGFLGVLKGLNKGPIFYEPLNLRAIGDEIKGNRHVKKVGERLAEWVRKDVGITDPDIKPNHAWRHLFKTLSADAGIEERVADAIQGHAPGTTGRKYGKISVQAKAAALERFPRFKVD